jgi:hypothetical protein
VGELADAGAAAKSGLYWIADSASDAGGVLTYCDLPAGVALCSTEMGDHFGVMKDPSASPFQITSVLQIADGGAISCVFSALHNGSDGFPFENGGNECALLGFNGGTLALGDCPFGPNLGTCGQHVGSCVLDPQHPNGGYWAYAPGPYHETCVETGDAVTGGTCAITP